jgi:glucokinase
LTILEAWNYRADNVIQYDGQHFRKEDTVSHQLLAGVDIGGTKTAVTISAHPPEILARSEFPTAPADGPAQAIARIIESVHQSLLARGWALNQLRAIGISCGGPLDPVRGLIQEPPNLPTWKDIAICSILEERFGVDCFLENDANAGALAEFSFGAGRGTRDMIFLTMGTGIGAGLILNGQLHRGSSMAAGEIGHVRLTHSGPRGHNKVGTVEGWASGAGMAQVATMEIRAAQARGESSLLTAVAVSGSRSLTARDVALAAHTGDRVAQAIVRKVGEKLGEAMAILVDLLNPECIVVGGLALRFGDSLLNPARDIVERDALGSSASLCRIVPAQLGEHIGDVAALCVAMKGLEHDRLPTPESAV